ncbi:hypothetical protein FTO70_12950 [Methanosarcina sp. KYL-1]|uniref:hypothetical protein n=1 Tax=Methanosarcina sp. KYL-1 TaxID=2602068 RepID=UPI002100ACEB|nr:hypothetical protein [Methanosarcina sp. KYL-1]MCQ1536561.1 hypothetical protein [Methanosarcina sp. KYL-1]
MYLQDIRYVMSLFTGFTGTGSVKEFHIGNSSIIPEHFRKQASARRKSLLPEIKLNVQFFFGFLLDSDICQGKSCLNILTEIEKTTSFWLCTGRMIFGRAGLAGFPVSG